MSDNDFDDFTKGLLFTLMYMMLGTDEERQAIFEQLPMKGGDSDDVRENQENNPERSL